MIVTIRVTSPWLVSCLTAVEECVRSVRSVPFFEPEPWFAVFRTSWPKFGKLPTAAAGLILCASATTDLPAAYLKPLPPDARIAHLNSFFRLYNCPQPHHTSEYLRAADGYGLDYRLLPAISVRETLCGVGAEGNNRWGYHPGRRSFPSIREGIDFVARELAQGFFYKGKTLRQKLFTYNPRKAYPDEIQSIMRQIELMPSEQFPVPCPGF